MMTDAPSYTDAREAIQWIISARVMWRQAEEQQPSPDPDKLAALNMEIDRLIKEWSSIDPADSAAHARIHARYAPEVVEIFAVLEAKAPSPH